MDDHEGTIDIGFENENKRYKIYMCFKYIVLHAFYKTLSENIFLIHQFLPIIHIFELGDTNITISD